MKASNVATLSSSALLVDLSISLWSGKKLDKKVSSDVDSLNSTQTRAGNYNKSLLAGDNSLSEIQKVVTMIRTYHTNTTSPWFDTGPRLLPTALFFDYKKEIGRLEQVYWDAVNTFLPEYSNKIEAAKIALGDLFNRSEYPTTEEVGKKFKFSINYQPIAESGDFRVDVGNQGLVELKEQYESQYQQNIETAMSSVWDRLHKVLEQMSYGLRTEADGKTGRVFQSVFTNASELCSILTSLNITQDTKLEAMRVKLEDTLMGVDAEVCKKDYKVRVDTRAAIDSLLSKF